MGFRKDKVKVGIIGTGNIGTDLLVKINRSKLLQCSIFAGKNPRSSGISFAKSLGVNTSTKSIGAIVDNQDLCEIVFDATSAQAHKIHAPILAKMGKFVIDMTPSRIGKMCVPVLNLNESLKLDDINMVTCGGQATAPIVKSIMEIHPEIEYVEIVSSISSRSAGIGTRDNIDEYTQTTADAVKEFSKVKNAKAIIILNPADPPILMHNTIFAKVKNAKITLLRKKINETVGLIQKYVPGYKLTLDPVAVNGKLILMSEVLGRGDYLPSYAGNLDIINCAAVAVAEEYALKNI